MNSEFRLAVVGDINLEGFIPGDDYFEHILPYLREVDCAIGNLEGLFAEPEELMYKPGFKHVGPGHAPGLAEAGFTGLNLANNVSFGEAAIRTTLEQLEGAGIAHTGAGMTLAEARQPATMAAAGRTVGIVGRTSVFYVFGHAATEHQAGIVPLRVSTSYRPHHRHYELPGAKPVVITIPEEEDLQCLTDDLAALRPEVDVLVAFLHFGVSSEREVIQYQRTVARAAIDAGADVVVGSHAHVIQPVEVYRGCPIVYGMGQVIFGWDFVAKVLHPGRPGLLVELEIDDVGDWHWSLHFVVPDKKLMPRFAAFEEVPEDVDYLKATSSEVLKFGRDRISIAAPGRLQ